MSHAPTGEKTSCHCNTRKLIIFFFFIKALQCRNNTEWSRVILLMTSILLLSPLFWMTFLYLALTCPTWTTESWPSFKHLPVSARGWQHPSTIHWKRLSGEDYQTASCSRCWTFTSPSEMCSWANPEKKKASLSWFCKVEASMHIAGIETRNRISPKIWKCPCKGGRSHFMANTRKITS